MAIINVIYANWDAVNEPPVGCLSDNTRCRCGRRRPWLLTGLTFYLVLFLPVYAVPSIFRQGNALFWYALIVIFLSETASTVMVTAFIAGAGLGGVKVCREMMMVLLVDRSLARTGRRQEGVYYGLDPFIGRLSKLLEALALILLCVFSGYVSGEKTGPNPDDAFSYLISVFPFICMVAAWLLARKFRLEDDQALIQAEQLS